MLGSWVRIPAGSPKEKPKGDNKKTSPAKSIFCGTFLLPFGDPDRQKEGIGGQKSVPHSYPLKVMAGEAVDSCFIVRNTLVMRGIHGVGLLIPFCRFSKNREAWAPSIWVW